MRADGVVFQGQVGTSGGLETLYSVDADGYPSFAMGKLPDGSQHGIWTVNGWLNVESIEAVTKFKTDAGTSTQGMLDLTFDALYNRPSSLATVARAGYLVGGGPGFLDIAADGSISGHEPTIGDYSGQISLIDPAYNLYRVQLTLTAVGSMAGVVFVGNGLATMDDSVSPSRLMIVGVSTQSGVTYSWVDKWCTAGGC
jgi:hypothetical protein